MATRETDRPLQRFIGQRAPGQLRYPQNLHHSAGHDRYGPLRDAISPARCYGRCLDSPLYRRTTIRGCGFAVGVDRDSLCRLPDSKTDPKRLYLNRPAIDVLDRLGWEASGAVFGDRLSRARLDKQWQFIRERASLRDVRLHDLRHSFASVAIGRGISLAKLGGILGHELPETTTRYAHLADELVHEAAGRVSRSMARALGVAI